MAMDSTEDQALRYRIVEYLERHSTLSLATCQGGQPWVANLFYASDESLRLFFLSSGSSLHCRHIAASPRVSVSISGQYDDWASIKGLQLAGTASEVSAAARSNVMDRYLERFPNLRRMLQAGADDSERLIASRLLSSPFYCIQPRWIRLIDNSRGFGNKQELRLGTGDAQSPVA